MQDLDGSRADAALDGIDRTGRARLADWLADAPLYPPNAGDLRTVSILGLALPVRTTVAVLTVSLLLLLDYHGRINGLVDALVGLFGAGAAEAKRLQAIGRLVIEGAGILAVMPPDAVPPEIRAIADARSDARRARDWATADRRKGELEAAGWKVIDAASLYTLERARPPDVEVGGSVRYGSTASVPSRLHDAPVGVATVMIVVTDDVAGSMRQAEAIAAGVPDGTQVVIVANAPTDEDGDALAALDRLDAADPGAPGVAVEVVRTATRFGAAAAWNVGLRRAAAPVVVLLGQGIVVPAALVPAIIEALGDESVAVAGPIGLVSDDLRSFRAAPADAVDVDAIAADAMGFRREDAAARGLLDEHFVGPDHLGTWWSLVLRDPADDDDEDAEPRRAVQVPVDLTTAADSQDVDDADPARARLAKRNFYRFLKRFATRRDLIGSAARGDD